MNKFLARQTDAMAMGLTAEAKAAKRLGGRSVIGSGSMQGVKGDIILDKGLLSMVEVKTTFALSISLKYSWLKKVAEEALLVRRKPALLIQFAHTSGKPREDGAWVMIPESVYKSLVETANANEVC